MERRAFWGLAAALLAVGTPVPLAGHGEPDAPSPRTRAALPVAATAGYGASMPFDEYEAENARTDGEHLGPDTRFGVLAAEASGRRAVRLAGRSRYLEFTLARPANAITIRYALPDSADGRGMDGSLTLTTHGRMLASVPVTSRYSWFYGRYPFSNRPGDGGGHHGFDHARALFGRTLPAGTNVRLTIGTSALPWIAVDLADFELVPPPARPPADAVTLVTQGGDPTGHRSSGAAMRRGIALAHRTGRVLWVDPGTYRIDGHVLVDRITIQGAGQWWSTLRGKDLGLYGRAAPRGSSRVVLRDLAVIGEVDERRDDQPLSGIGGAFNDTLIERVWLQHHKVGIWLDGPMHRVLIRQARIVDMTADGVNFHKGVTNSGVEDTLVRGTGDDGLAAWSHHLADAHLWFRRNTVVAPVLANGIALYGGRDIRIEHNLVADILTQGGGIHVGNRFDAVPASGVISISHNMLVRAGSWDPNWKFGVGALWFYALDHPLTARIRVTDLYIRRPVEEGVSFIGSRIDGVSLHTLRLTDTVVPCLVARSAGHVALEKMRSCSRPQTAVRILNPLFSLAQIERTAKR